jgi:hypothetical protein
MRAAIPNQVSLHGASLSPGEVAEGHRKKVSSEARVREHTARRYPADTLEYSIL